MDAKEIAHELATEHQQALAQLKVGAMSLVPRPKGFFNIRDAIAFELEGWLTEYMPEAEFEVTHAGRDDYQVKRIA